MQKGQLNPARIKFQESQCRQDRHTQIQKAFPELSPWRLRRIVQISRNHTDHGQQQINDNLHIQPGKQKGRGHECQYKNNARPSRLARRQLAVVGKIPSHILRKILPQLCRGQHGGNKRKQNSPQGKQGGPFSRYNQM